MNIDTDTIDQIVTGVLNQLAGRGDGAPDAATVQAQSRRGRAAAVEIPENVVTAETLLVHVDDCSRIVVSDRAIVTPAAWDAAKERKIEIVRASASGECGVGTTAASKRKEASMSGLPLLIVVHSIEAGERLWEDIRKGWRRELLGCPDDAAALAISAICRGETTAVVILATQSHRAACLANRNDKVKAVALQDAGSVRMIQRQLRANVWCIDPTGRLWIELRNLLRAIAEN